MKANDVNQSIVTLNQLAPIAAAFAVPERSLTAIRAALSEGSASVAVSDRTSGVTRTDGKLTFAEFAARGVEGFTRADANKDGTVTVAELQALRPGNR